MVYSHYFGHNFHAVRVDIVFPSLHEAEIEVQRLCLIIAYRTKLSHGKSYEVKIRIGHVNSA